MTTVDIRLRDRVVAAATSGDVVRIGDRVFTVVAIGRGFYRVSEGDRYWTVAVVGPPHDRWIFVDGQVARVELEIAGPKSLAAKTRSTRHELASPMPATVVRILVKEGVRVSRGDTLIILEAMKMELPVRAPRDGVVRAVHCEPGELVQPGVTLLDLE